MIKTLSKLFFILHILSSNAWSSTNEDEKEVFPSPNESKCVYLSEIQHTREEYLDFIQKEIKRFDTMYAKLDSEHCNNDKLIWFINMSRTNIIFWHKIYRNVYILNPQNVSALYYACNEISNNKNINTLAFILCNHKFLLKEYFICNQYKLYNEMVFHKNGSYPEGHVPERLKSKLIELEYVLSLFDSDNIFKFLENDITFEDFIFQMNTPKDE